ncbi:hypothetical protein ACIPW9_12155 [Streptomyces sp. NPDC090052]|uniref:hypothetical protein n=1 Tax=unclassified Streptomyces TaxID=2593676 RepID=UPI00225113BB|nr:hypothetical protein [Streptomyces sp. NBC_01306]MCX4725919.1 hypothetical protein [Streptomyces sp. NBC_01306]WSV04746.1 hypothetical protein OG372_14765 [Streptomyces sp. NBC_01020]WSX42809.1 hypothetical protein OG760_14450 [Streptomyces sp. NBC_00963]WSX69174.1 hypothetical protein OG221_22650 [Streptomyces sp. NBC_00932]
MTLTKKLFATAALVLATAAASATPALANGHVTDTDPSTAQVRAATVGPDNGHITAAPLESRAA